MDVDLLTLPLKVTVGLVVWTIALLTYRVFQAVVEDESFMPSAKPLETKAPADCENRTREYFLKSSETCTCTGVITGVVTHISESDRFRLFHGEPGFSQMDETLHVRLTGLEKPHHPGAGSTRTRMLETVVEIEEESETSSTTSSITSRQLSLNPYCGSFTLPHDHDGDFLPYDPYVDDRLPGTHNSLKNSKWNVNDSVNVGFKLPWTHYSQEKPTSHLVITRVPHSEHNNVNQDVPRNSSHSTRNDQGDILWRDSYVHDRLPDSYNSQKKQPQRLENAQARHSERIYINQDVHKNSSPTIRNNNSELLCSEPYVDDRLSETYNSWKNPSLEIVQVQHSERSYVSQDVLTRNISPPISVIPVAEPPILHNENDLSNSVPKYDQLYKKLHQELSKFKIQRRTNPDETNHDDVDNSNKTDHSVMMMHVHAHNQAVAESYNDIHTTKGNMISDSPNIAVTSEKRMNIGTNEIALVNQLKIPPSITPRVKQVPHYHGEVLTSFKPVFEHHYIGNKTMESVAKLHQAFGISHKTETSLDGVQIHVNNNNEDGDCPVTIIPDPQIVIKPYASVRKGLKLETNPNHPLLNGELGVKLPHMNINEQNQALNQLLILDKNRGYGQIIRTPLEVTVEETNLDGKSDPKDLQTILDPAEREGAELHPTDDDMNSTCKDSARLCLPVLHEQLASGTYLETFSPGYNSLDLCAGDLPGKLISIRRLSSTSSSNSVSSSGDGWPTTWDDSPCVPSTPDSDIQSRGPIPILEDVCLCSGKISGLVEHVTDGDGFYLLHACDGISGLDEVCVRLAGIDAPEFPAQPFSGESKTHLEKLVLQKYVDVETFGTDQYGRVLGMVYLPSLVNVNLEMVRSGYACVYTNIGAVYGEYEEDFKRLEKEAKILKMGMWSQKNVVLPGEFKRLRYLK